MPIRSNRCCLHLGQRLRPSFSQGSGESQRRLRLLGFKQEVSSTLFCDCSTFILFTNALLWYLTFKQMVFMTLSEKKMVFICLKLISIKCCWRWKDFTFLFILTWELPRQKKSIFNNIKDLALTVLFVCELLQIVLAVGLLKWLNLPKFRECNLNDR